jgi:uncharacterized membrane protein YbhN (UPF0104 family)
MNAIARFVFKVFRRPMPDAALHWSVVIKALGWTLGCYGLYGLHLWLLANSLQQPGLRDLLLCIGAQALGMTAGMLAFFLPSGLGAREAVLVGALALTLTTGQATTLAVGSRIMFTLGDLALAGLAALAAVRQRPKEVSAA